MRKAIIGDLKSKSVPEAVIRETAQKLIASEYLERVCKVHRTWNNINPNN